MAVIALSLAAASLFAYKYWQLKQQVVQTQPSPLPKTTAIPTATPAPTANWKTYTDEKYGFSFAYPQNWKATTLADSGLLTLSANIANDHTISLVVWQVTGFGYCYKYGDRKKIVVGGKEAETADGIGGTIMCDQPKEVISKRGNTYVLIPLGIDNTLSPNQIHISYDYLLSDINLAKSNLDQILSTFKFIPVIVSPSPIATSSADLQGPTL